MPTLIDTTCWSTFLRRQPIARLNIDQLRLRRLVGELMASGEGLVIGVVRQELLSGVRSDEQFRRVREIMRSVPDSPVTTLDHETAAQFHNTCRRAGMQGSPADFLLCAVATRLGAPILTADRDFQRYRELLRIQLVDI